MGQHLRGKLGPAGRIELVRLMREDGLSERAAAAALSVAPSTAHHWSVRERRADAGERACGAWALDRSSRPLRCPRQTPSKIERRVCEARRRTGWGPRLLAVETGVAHSTISAILKRYPRFARPGHAVTGDRSRTYVDKARPLGHDFFHAI